MAEILVVDDQIAMRNMFKKFFKLTEHNVDYAEDGQEAYKLAKGKIYQLILADLVMPKMDGIG